MRGSAAESLVGVWRLEAIRERYEDGRSEDHPDFGADPDGLLIYTESGYISVQFLRRARPMFTAEDDPTPAERAAAAEGYGAYAGRYEVDEAKALVHHHVEVALIPNRVGRTLTRRFSLSGDRLALSALDARYRGIEVDRTLFWRRV